ncbi:MAG: hypothetical protein ACYC3I_16365 [Gemmataceae bacterium]
MTEQNYPWCRDNKTGFWTAEASDLPRGPIMCPVCGDPITKDQLTATDRSPDGEDVAGWQFRCGCGAKILVIND